MLNVLVETRSMKSQKHQSNAEICERYFGIESFWCIDSAEHLAPVGS